MRERDKRHSSAHATLRGIYAALPYLQQQPATTENGMKRPIPTPRYTDAAFSAVLDLGLLDFGVFWNNKIVLMFWSNSKWGGCLWSLCGRTGGTRPFQATDYWIRFMAETFSGDDVQRDFSLMMTV